MFDEEAELLEVDNMRASVASKCPRALLKAKYAARFVVLKTPNEPLHRIQGFGPKPHAPAPR
jgi:hypothetical protein